VTSYSNLSKLKPAFRTKGNVTGNFGAPKRTREAYNSGLGVTNAKVVKVTKEEDYLRRLYDAFDATTDEKMKKFLYEEIRKILIRNNKWSGDSF
jgi:hypothetical protein